MDAVYVLLANRKEKKGDHKGWPLSATAEVEEGCIVSPLLVHDTKIERARSANDEDFIARRSRLAFLDTDTACRVMTRLIGILASEHKWDNQRQKQEFESATRFHESFKSFKECSA